MRIIHVLMQVVRDIRLKEKNGPLQMHPKHLPCQKQHWRTAIMHDRKTHLFMNYSLELEPFSGYKNVWVRAIKSKNIPAWPKTVYHKIEAFGEPQAQRGQVTVWYKIMWADDQDKPVPQGWKEERAEKTRIWSLSGAYHLIFRVAWTKIAASWPVSHTFIYDVTAAAGWRFNSTIASRLHRLNQTPKQSIE